MTLEMRDQENQEIGREIGRVMGMVSLLREFDIPDADIFQKIQEKYNLSHEEIEHYMGMGVKNTYQILWLHDPEKMKEGLEVGFSNMWSSLRDFNLDQTILQKIQEKYNLSHEEVEYYMQTKT